LNKPTNKSSPTQSGSLTYRDSGVDIDAGDRLVENIKPFAKRTMRPEVLGGIGGFGALGDVAFLMISYLGIVMLARWLIVDGWWQVWWGVFLLPLLTGTVLLQRYVEPAILVFMFFVARPRDALKVLDSPVVWFYPVFNLLYSLSRALSVAGGVA